MVDKGDVVNAGEQISPSPSVLPLKNEDQFRLVNQRLDTLANEVERISKPPTFRTADVVNLGTIVIGLVIGGFAALGLTERISDVNTHQADVERRIDASTNAMEQRLGARLDKLSEQFTAMDERTSRLEGEQSVERPKTTKTNEHQNSR